MLLLPCSLIAWLLLLKLLEPFPPIDQNVEELKTSRYGRRRNGWWRALPHKWVSKWINNHGWVNFLESSQLLHVKFLANSWKLPYYLCTRSTPDRIISLKRVWFTLVPLFSPYFFYSLWSWYDCSLKFWLPMCSAMWSLFLVASLQLPSQPIHMICFTLIILIKWVCFFVVHQGVHLTIHSCRFGLVR